MASDHLEEHGWEIVERNARFDRGELDLVARDGDTLVFVEVKAIRLATGGQRSGPERAVLAVDLRKQRRLRYLAARWLTERGCPPGVAEFRFDVIGIEFASGSSHRAVRTDHLRDAF